MRSAQDNAAIRVPFDSDHLLQAIVPLLKSLEKRAIIVTKLITLIHMADFYVKQVRVKSMQPRIVVVGGSANSLSIIFSAGPLLESDFLFFSRRERLEKAPHKRDSFGKCKEHIL